MELTKIILPSSGARESFSNHAEQLRDRLATAMKIVDQMSGVPAVRPVNEQVSEHNVRALLKLRRNRDRFFGSDIFADPAWDILLELYAAALAQLRISISSLCVGAAVPTTTALRWINLLEEKGLISRRADPTDGRRYFIMLTPQGLEAMEAYFRTVPSGQPLI